MKGGKNYKFFFFFYYKINGLSITWIPVVRLEVTSDPFDISLILVSVPPMYNDSI